MDASSLVGLTVHEARSLLDSRRVSAVELTRAALDRIEQVEDRVKAFVTVTADPALDQASEADRRIAEGRAAPLTGIPMQLKDNMATRGIPTTCSSRMLEGFVPPYDSTVTRRLYDQSAVLVGKGNLDEFAMGSSTENSAFFPTRNPWDLDRVPGGSSGGPAVAVAASECVFSLGSDTGGSIRQPASLCGVVGLKPTYGLVSRYGLVAFASSLDQIGPITKDVRDCAIVLNAIAGNDPRDSTSLKVGGTDYTAVLESGGGSLKGLRIGVPSEYFVDGMDPEVESSTRRSIALLEDLGAEVSETSLPHTSFALAVYYILAPSECSANLARYDGVKYGFLGHRGVVDVGGAGAHARRRVRPGGQAPNHAGHLRAFFRLLRRFLPEGAEGADDHPPRVRAGLQGVRRYRVGNLADGGVQAGREDGRPGPDVPVRRAHSARKHRRTARDVCPCGPVEGRSADRLSDTGGALGEETIFRIAHAFEQVSGWNGRRPDL